MFHGLLDICNIASLCHCVPAYFWYQLDIYIASYYIFNFLFMCQGFWTSPFLKQARHIATEYICNISFMCRGFWTSPFLKQARHIATEYICNISFMCRGFWTSLFLKQARHIASDYICNILFMCQGFWTSLFLNHARHIAAAEYICNILTPADRCLYNMNRIYSIISQVTIIYV